MENYENHKKFKLYMENHKKFKFNSQIIETEPKRALISDHSQK